MVEVFENANCWRTVQTLLKKVVVGEGAEGV